MTTVATLYNNLPSVWEADEKFVNRDEIFSKLAPLLAAHRNRFGVCLVHRHCTLEEGEVMVASGNVSQPERDVLCNPERWLASGEPYEFTRKETCPPPQELLEEFQKIVDGIEVLGLFYVQDEDRSGVTVEKTEGRTNIVEIQPLDHNSDSSCISTGWLLLTDYNNSDSDNHPQIRACIRCQNACHLCVLDSHAKNKLTTHA